MPSNYVHRFTAALLLFFSFSFFSFGRTEASEIPFFRSYANITPAVSCRVFAFHGIVRKPFDKNFAQNIVLLSRRITVQHGHFVIEAT